MILRGRSRMWRLIEPIKGIGAQQAPSDNIDVRYDIALPKIIDLQRLKAFKDQIEICAIHLLQVERSATFVHL
ncbi:hypothetical protein SAMN05518668_10521 [Sphingobium sp. YR657]|uniref:Uncharacterized protein n=1 Tax=Sphingobium yanoikuyae ATCC 51230 TaxID=883163 RepID=K9D4L6_SPHYA|nr:hypothetical protein HMPREF9718_03535 [Sphingobium yanoikuyae ATCC 51230]SHM01879.1 hypothetical protein SAMN05518668_10521 [Sphingobium sp. YR657]